MGKFFARWIACVHVVAADVVIDRLRPHAADDRQLVGVAGQLRQVFADLYAVHVGLDRTERSPGGTSRLHVKRVNLAGAALHVEHDAALAGTLRFRGDGLGMEQGAPIGHGHSAGRDERALEHAAAAEVMLLMEILNHRGLDWNVFRAVIC